MEYELDDIAGDTEKFLGPFRIWKESLHVKGSIIKTVKMGMSVDAQL